MINNKRNIFSFKRKQNQIIPLQGEVVKKSHPNVALIKYWGKSDSIQIPLNASISFLVKKLYTITRVVYFPRRKIKENISIKLFFSGEKNYLFLPKVKNFFNRISIYCSYIKYLNFIIETNNTFPHSSGLGSSSSAMSSLALCVMEIEKRIIPSLKKSFFFKKASFLARLGSGSACRSIYPGLSIWGHHSSIKGSNNLYSIPYPYKIHPIFKTMKDTILIIDQKIKKISSSSGHILMKNNPYSKVRFKVANRNMDKIIYILKTGNIKEFGKIIEYEALNLHSMIMTSIPYFIYFHPNTIKIINSIWNFRIKSQKNLFFTLDAGPNIHLIYPLEENKLISEWIYDNIFPLCKKIVNSNFFFN